MSQRKPMGGRAAVPRDLRPEALAPEDVPEVPEPTVSERLQAILDGPTDQGNAVALPPGEHELDARLVIRRRGTRIRRQDKWGGGRATFVGPLAHDPFRFEYAGPVPGVEASIVFVDDPGFEVTAAGRTAIDEG